MNKNTALDIYDKLEELLTHANEFCFQLKELPNYKQDTQLDYILPYLNKLVVDDYIKDWDSDFVKDTRFIRMIYKLQGLKEVRNKIVHHLKTMSYDEYMEQLKYIYEYAENINHIIYKNLNIIKEEYNIL